MPQVLHTTERGQEFRYVLLKLKTNVHQAERCRATQFQRVQCHRTLSELECMEVYYSTTAGSLRVPQVGEIASHRKDGLAKMDNWILATI